METELRLLSPWMPPHSAEGLLLELKREVASDHPLFAKSARALAAARDRDDVLFEISDGQSQRYAVVHLTWTGKQETGTFPHTDFFDSLSQWLEWMKADHEDYTYGDKPQDA